MADAPEIAPEPPMDPEEARKLREKEGEIFESMQEIRINHSSSLPST
jgi:hypothetical protein